jgi:ABC-type branched-subunit amino acid transport system ATPase component
MSLVLPVSDYVYVLDFGKVLAKGRPSAIQNDPKVIAAYLGEESDKTAGEVLSATRKPVGAPLLEVKQLAAGYGHLEVIRDVNLTVRPGEVVACIGANGAGKTTTLRAVSGMIHPRSGKVTFNGRDITGQTSEQISRQGLLHIPEGRGLFPNLSVEDTLRLVSNSIGKEPDVATAYRLFPKLKERRHQAVGTLSGGEQQMVALARAVLARPQLVMVDEMSQGLAPTVVRQLFDTIRMMRDEGIAVLIVEQFVEQALEVADRAYVFEHGTIGHSGSAADLRADRKLISGSYLGTAVAAVAADGNGHHADPALMEIVSVKMPATLKRTLEERAEKEGRPTGAVVMELLEKVKR